MAGKVIGPSGKAIAAIYQMGAVYQRGACHIQTFVFMVFMSVGQCCQPQLKALRMLLLLWHTSYL